jgi:tetratricopeptide (TPR) repeat protein
MGQYSKALEIFSEALLLANSTPVIAKNNSIVATLISNKAATYYFTGDKDNCISAYKTAVEIYQESCSDEAAMESWGVLDLEDCIKGIADTFRNLAYVYAAFRMDTEQNQLERIVLSLEDIVP